LDKKIIKFKFDERKKPMENKPDETTSFDDFKELYGVEKQEDLTTLIDNVNALLNRGWVPCGGIKCVKLKNKKPFYLQALRKKR
jgi:hypothetical protein